MGALSLFDLFTYCFREGCATMKSNSVAVSLFLTSCFCAVVLSAPQPASIPRVVRYIRDAAPEDYVRTKRAHPSQTAYFSLALPQKNVDVLLDTLHRISNPKNPEYGKWLTKEEVYDIVGTPHDVVEQVRSWLNENGPGLHKAVFTGDSFLISCSVHYAERLFQTELHEFYNYALMLLRLSILESYLFQSTWTVTLSSSLELQTSHLPPCALGNHPRHQREALILVMRRHPSVRRII